MPLLPSLLEIDFFLAFLHSAIKAAEVAGAEREPKAAPAAKPYVSRAVREEMMERAYARGIELTNGRYAMMGFLAAILVEASTGDGILGQVFQYIKMSGLLGENSGF